MTMIAALVLLASVNSATDVAKAQNLYDKALYERALKALGDSCDQGGELIPCERLRAFILLAVGRDADARAAFQRMLVENPDASLGPDVAPKLLTLFNNAKRDVVELQNLELETIDTKAIPGSWGLKAHVPDGIELKALTAFVGSEDQMRFGEVPLKKEGGIWLGSTKAADSAKLKYYLVATLVTDVSVMIGSETAPLVRAVPAGTGSAGPSGDGDGGANGGHSAFDSSGVAATAPGGAATSLPPWAIWSIVGGAAAVVVVGVTLAVVLTRESKPGTILVNFELVEPPP
jgi:hypothetical protein